MELFEFKANLVYKVLQRNSCLEEPEKERREGETETENEISKIKKCKITT